MKKILALILAGALVLVLAACSGGRNTERRNQDQEPMQPSGKDDAFGTDCQVFINNMYADQLMVIFLADDEDVTKILESAAWTKEKADESLTNVPDEWSSSSNLFIFGKTAPNTK